MPAIILLFRDWKHYDKRTIRYKQITKVVMMILALTAILSTCLLWLDPWIQNKINTHELNSARPQITLEFIERSDTQVVFEVYYPATNTAPVDDLFFKFDIPGDYLASDISNKDKMESCVVSSTSLLGDGLAETVHVHCKSIFPQGVARGVVTFDRTRIRSIPNSVELWHANERYLPFLDLHDYSRCRFSWTHNGTPQMEQFYVSLTNLHYIREDNKNLIEASCYDEFYDGLTDSAGNPVTNPDPVKYNDFWIREREEKRKNW